MLDYGTLPPEINSERMHSGPGFGPDAGRRRGLGGVGHRFGFDFANLRHGDRDSARRKLVWRCIRRDGERGYALYGVGGDCRRAG